MEPVKRRKKKRVIVMRRKLPNTTMNTQRTAKKAEKTAGFITFEISITGPKVFLLTNSLKK